MGDTVGEEVCSSGEETLLSTADPNILSPLKISDWSVCSNDQRKNRAVEDALSNFPVLRCIFGMMDDEDLVIIRQVCKYWRTVADTMMSTRYDLELGESSLSGEGPSETDQVVMKKWDRDNRRSFTEMETNYECAAEVLKEEMRSHQVSIKLKVEDDVDIRNGRGKKFFSKFGHHVVELEFCGTIPMPLNSFCKLLLHDFPNLKSLNMSGLEFEDDSLEDQTFSPELPQNKHGKLTRISFSHDVDWNICSMKKILKMFPKLEKISQMPVKFVKAVKQANKIHALKSLLNEIRWSHYDENPTVFTDLEELAQFQPKLMSFEQISWFFWFDVDNRTLRTMASSVFSILESSSESLNSLIVFPSERYGFQIFPKMTRLKSLEVCHPVAPHTESMYREFFPRDVVLQDIFPNVNDFRLDVYLALSESWVDHYLPVSVFLPWGTQIKQLRLRRVSPDSLNRLQTLFPNIQELQLEDSENTIAEVLQILPHLWPELKSLIVGIESTSIHFDKAFTGISEETLNLLLDPTERENFSDVGIQRFKDRSTICKFKALKELRIVLYFYWMDDKLRETLARLSPLSNEFGFDLLQDLKVTVGIREGRQFQAIKKELEPFADSGNIEIVQDPGVEKW